MCADNRRMRGLDKYMCVFSSQLFEVHSAARSVDGRQVSVTAVAQDGHDCVAWPQLLGGSHGPDTVECGGAADEEALLSQAVLRHAERLTVRNTVGRVDTCMQQVACRAHMKHTSGRGGGERVWRGAPVTRSMPTPSTIESYRWRRAERSCCCEQ